MNRHWDKFVLSVIEWARVRDIYEQSTEKKQVSKAIEEVAELVEAQACSERVDAIGDIAVCVINAAYIRDRKALGLPAPRCTGPGTSLGNICGRIIDGWYSLGVGGLRDYAEEKGYRFSDCCDAAWEEIKDRKGMMIDGKFVKWEDLNESERIILLQRINGGVE